MKYFVTQYWKIIIGIIAVFIGGLGFGGVLESLRHRSEPEAIYAQSKPSADWIDSTIASLDAQLHLSEAQKNAIRPQVENVAREIQLSRESALLKFELSLLELHRAIAPELDATQMKQLQRSQKNLEKRIKQRSDALLRSESGGEK